ncbi:lipoprotein, partial [gut metagenome]
MFMKKYIVYLMTALTLTGGFTACSDDDLSQESNFDQEAPYRTAFDKWLVDNYVTPYNIDFKYRFEYKESDTKYNLAPAELNKSIAMAK